jgi:hypothetical protein
MNVYIYIYMYLYINIYTHVQNSFLSLSPSFLSVLSFFSIHYNINTNMTSFFSSYGFVHFIVYLIVSVLRSITQMVIAGGLFFLLFFSFRTKANRSMVIGGGAFFRPLSQSLRWRLVARGLFSFFFFSFVHLLFFELLPVSQSLNGDWWRGLFSPPKPIAQTAVGGEGPFFLSFFFLPL